VVVGGGVLAGGRVVTGSDLPQENGLYQTICYSVSFYLIFASCSDAGQNVGSEESNGKDD
jgi:hypothetical protein